MAVLLTLVFYGNSRNCRVCTKAAEPESRPGAGTVGFVQGVCGSLLGPRGGLQLPSRGPAPRWPGPAPPCTGTGAGRPRACARPFAAPVGALGGPARRSRDLIAGAAGPRATRPCCGAADMASTSRYGGGLGAGGRGRSGSDIAPVRGTGRGWLRRPLYRLGTERRPSPPLPGPLLPF